VDKNSFLLSANRNFTLKEASRTNLRDVKTAATQEKTPANPREKPMSQFAQVAAAKQNCLSSPVPTGLFIAVSVSRK